MRYGYDEDDGWILLVHENGYQGPPMLFKYVRSAARKVSDMMDVPARDQ